MDEARFKLIVTRAVIDAAKDDAQANGLEWNDMMVYAYLNNNALTVVIDGIYRQLASMYHIELNVIGDKVNYDDSKI